MLNVYGICAIIGGTVMVCQFLMTLLGLAHADHGDLGGHADFDAGHGDVGGHDFDAGHDVGADHDFADDHVSSTWLFGVISFRTVVSALAFFGLAGLAADAAELQLVTTFAIALSSGVAAMYLVHWMMQSLYRLREDGTVRIQSAVGKTAAVYLRIPGAKAGVGKVTVSVQGRSMEYPAMTSQNALPTGARVVVTDVIDRNTLEVESVDEAEPAEVSSQDMPLG